MDLPENFLVFIVRSNLLIKRDYRSIWKLILVKNVCHKNMFCLAIGEFWSSRSAHSNWVYSLNISFSFSAFECTFCDRKYAYKGDLNKHLQIHVGNNIYTCEQCGMGFSKYLDHRNHTFEHYKQNRLKLGENSKANASNAQWNGHTTYD